MTFFCIYLFWAVTKYFFKLNLLKQFLQSKQSMGSKEKWCFLGRGGEGGGQVGPNPIETTGAFNKVTPAVASIHPPTLPLQTGGSKNVTYEESSHFRSLLQKSKIKISGHFGPVFFVLQFWGGEVPSGYSRTEPKDSKEWTHGCKNWQQILIWIPNTRKNLCSISVCLKLSCKDDK